MNKNIIIGAVASGIIAAKELVDIDFTSSCPKLSLGHMNPSPAAETKSLQICYKSMSKNPFLKALAAALYIAAVASMMYYGPQRVGPAESVLVPIAMLSLFVLSAAVMGYLFIYEPVRLYLDGEKKKAAEHFIKTLGTFAIITGLLLAALFFAF